MKTEFNIIIPASLTGGATILSVITGMVSGVSTGVVLLRAIITAVITFLFVMASRWAVKTFLPELLTSGDNETPGQTGTTAAAAEQAGTRVNIVMDDDPEAPAGNLRMDGDLDGQVDRLDTGDNQFAEPDGNVHNSKPEESAMETVTILDGGNSVDVLPSLDNLNFGTVSGSSQEEPEDLDNPSESEVSLSSPQGGSDLGANSDPAEIAKAVKTVLSRDQQK